MLYVPKFFCIAHCVIQVPSTTLSRNECFLLHPLHIHFRDKRHVAISLYLRLVYSQQCSNISQLIAAISPIENNPKWTGRYHDITLHFGAGIRACLKQRFSNDSSTLVSSNEDACLKPTIQIYARGSRLGLCCLPPQAAASILAMAASLELLVSCRRHYIASNERKAYILYSI
jgi:hypothetical protein